MKGEGGCFEWRRSKEGWKEKEENEIRLLLTILGSSLMTNEWMRSRGECNEEEEEEEKE